MKVSRNIGRHLVWGICFFLFLLVSSQQVAAQEQQVMRIADSYIIKDGRTLVPMRAIFETHGAEVSWNATSQKITGKNQNTSVTLEVGNKTALVNNQKVSLDVSPVVQNGRTFVPIRFVSETFGSKVQWDQATKTVLVHKNPMILVINNQKDKVKEFSFQGIQIGDPAILVDTLLAQSQRTSLSRYGFEWKTYHENYQNFIMVGIQNGAVVGLYSSSASMKSKNGLGVGSSLAQARKILGKPIDRIVKNNMLFKISSEDGLDYFKQEGYYATLFYDVHQNTTLTSVLLIDAKVEEAFTHHYGKAENKLRESYEWQNFDITNALRVRMGLDPLLWSDPLIKTTRTHSQDMIDRKFFDHTNPDGSSPFDRMSKDGVIYSLAGENIAMGQFDAIYVHEAWMNSVGHRKNIVAAFKYLTVGVAFDKDRVPYYTQNFYK
ncbi:stalk domain-containing protein [Caldalkalibacillus mannanilyticus]|uniref:stalk domain-containing protein n=1 Tax=Caldalkalibacillus mannanilyticus TaxID=1418 RepID=UPI000468AF36|nr:stalk domain-containing protein [Caldalkalibacillus mannanilyticus]